MQTLKKNYRLLRLLDLAEALISPEVLMIAGQTLGILPYFIAAVLRNDTLEFAAMYFSFSGIWVLTLLYWRIRKKYRPLFKALGPAAKGNNWKTTLALGLPCGFGLNFLLAMLAMWHGDIVLSFNEFNWIYFLLFLVCVGIQSGAEELVCRIHLYQNMRRLFPNRVLVAILVSALYFSVTHVGNDGVGVVALLDIFFSGLKLALFIYYFDSFWATVVAHTGWNFCQSIFLGLPNSGIVSAYSVFRLDAANARNSFFYNTAFGIEGTWAAVIAEALVCVLIWQIGRKRNQQPLDVWATESSV